MAEHIEREAVMREITEIKDFFSPTVRPIFDVAKHIVSKHPAADVVPRSEYESLRKRMFPSYVQACTQDDAMKIGYERGKIEVAKEIFDEIEFDIHQLMFERDEHRAIAIEGVIANLKKKYTEDVNNG